MAKEIHVCKNCGSENVEIRAWVDIKTNKCNQSHFLDEIEDEDTWCTDCETHSGIKIIEK